MVETENNDYIKIRVIKQAIPGIGYTEGGCLNPRDTEDRVVGEQG